MADLVSNHLNRIKQRALAADIKANQLKDETINEFYSEFSAVEISKMLSAINQYGHTFEQEAAKRIQAKIDAAVKLNFDEVNEAITLFESSYSNLLHFQQEVEEREVNNV